MYNSLIKIMKSFEGNVLAIGLDDALLDKLKHNNSINLYSVTSPKNSKKTLPIVKRLTTKSKEVNIKKLKKHINKKSADFIVLNMNEVFKYYKYIVRQTIYLCNNYIYVYATEDIDIEFIIDKYKRYNVEIECKKYKTGYILAINNKNGVNNYIKDKIYFIKDTLYNIAEMIGNVLVN